MTGCTKTADAQASDAGHCPLDRGVMALAPKRVLSICTGMGLLDRAFIDAGFEVVVAGRIYGPKRNV